jgi:ferredoxin
MAEAARLVVDRLLCDGNGICAGLAPALLQMTEHDELLVLRDTVLPHEREAALAAVRACPKSALSLVDQG